MFLLVIMERKELFMNTRNHHQSHLDLSKRIKIEKGIEEYKDFTQIAEDICKSSKTVSNEIKQGHSFAMIIKNHDFPIGKRTLYNYVEKGYLDIINLDLPRKVRYKKRKYKNYDVPQKGYQNSYKSDL